MTLNLNRGAKFVVAAAVFVSLACAASPGRSQQMVSITREDTNMRAGPGTRFKALWRLIRGYPLRVTGRSGQWFKVRDFEGDEGWVFRPLTGQTPHYIVKARAAYLRARPSARSRILGQVSYGDVLRTLAKRAGWVRVKHDGGADGWIARDLVWGW